MADGEMADYRQSHIEKGGVYDAELAADLWDSYMHRWEERHLREIVPSIFQGKAPRYLDFACGTGRMTAAVAPMAAEVVGVDISKSMLAVATQKLPNVKFILGDLTRERPDLGVFDLVTSFRFFGNAEPDLRSAALRALNLLQATGGYLIVNNHRNPVSLANMIHRARGNELKMDLTHRRLRGLMKAGGYKIVDVRPIGVWRYRAKIMSAVGANPERAETLERLFRARVFAPVAPDAVIVARKVQDHGHSG
jgi:SAM-dependent methyltransferase